MNDVVLNGFDISLFLGGKLIMSWKAYCEADRLCCRQLHRQSTPSRSVVDAEERAAHGHRDPPRIT